MARQALQQHLAEPWSRHESYRRAIGIKQHLMKAYHLNLCAAVPTAAHHKATSEAVEFGHIRTGQEADDMLLKSAW